MDKSDIIKAKCKQCGGDVEFMSRGIAPEGIDYDIESPDIPYHVVENVVKESGCCPHCGTSRMSTLTLSPTFRRWSIRCR